MPKIPLSDRPNTYWGHGLAPIECQLTIYCGTLDSLGFDRYVKDLRKDGIYYRHDKSRKEVTVAFKDKKMRDIHEAFLRLSAKADGKLLDKNPNDNA